jgi:hypothetical protein
MGGIMRTLFFIIVTLFLSLSGLYAQSQNCLTKNQILLTNEGIYCEIAGNICAVDTITYCAGQYIAIQKPMAAGQCDNCGSRFGPNGRCENQSCNNSGRNGPPDR